MSNFLIGTKYKIYKYGYSFNSGDLLNLKQKLFILATKTFDLKNQYRFSTRHGQPIDCAYRVLV